MRTLYFDCFAGASGDMILGGLLALGVGRNELQAELDKLGLPDVAIEVEVVDRSGISATHVRVNAPDQKAHRHLSEIVRIIGSSKLSQEVKSRSVEIFTRLARAEAKVHGIEIDAVHFHEVGALDAIVDVVGACICFEKLGIERFACSKIHVGSGFIVMEHGKYPVPPPAVAELLSGFAIYSTEIEGELVTPTGAAIISTLCDSYGHLPDVIPEKTGYGAGSREYSGFPNTLRLLLAETTESDAIAPPTDRLVLIETNLDDISPQILGFVMERAFDLGALDCWFTPIQMKKNRPGTMLSILCAQEKREEMSALLYRETTTLGIRLRSVERDCISREIATVETSHGKVDVKLARRNGRITNVMPEYEHVRRIALETGLPLRRVQAEVIAEFEKGTKFLAATD